MCYPSKINHLCKKKISGAACDKAAGKANKSWVPCKADGALVQQAT